MLHGSLNLLIGCVCDVAVNQAECFRLTKIQLFHFKTVLMQKIAVRLNKRKILLNVNIAKFRDWFGHAGLQHKFLDSFANVRNV